MAKKIFISDIHLSSKERYEDTEHPSWYIPTKHSKRLVNLLDYIIENAAEIKDVILLGDMFDAWICPVDATPPTYEEIFNDNQDIK